MLGECWQWESRGIPLSLLVALDWRDAADPREAAARALRYRAERSYASSARSRASGANIPVV